MNADASAASAGHPAAWIHRPAPGDQVELVEAFHRARPTSLGAARSLLGGRARRRARCAVREFDDADVDAATFAGLVDGAAAAVVRDVFTSDDVATMATALRTTRPRQREAALWALGVPWFAYGPAHAEAYAAEAARTNALIERVLPGLHRRLAAWCARVQGEPVTLREGWGGPGIVVFPAGSNAGTCGDIHFDWEGVIHEPTALDTEIYSLISMVSKPEHGGGLRVWGLGCRADRDRDAATEGPEGDDGGLVVDYRPGDMVVIDGLDLHQIDAFEGARDRACLTFHAARLAQGWRIWL